MEWAGIVRVNSVSRGAVDTPLQCFGLADPEVSARHKIWLKRYVPMNQQASSREIATVVAFLASYDASSTAPTS